MALAQVVMDALAPVMDQQLGRAAPGGAGALEIDRLVLAAAALAGFLVTIACSLVTLWASSATLVALALTGGQRALLMRQDGGARSTLIAIEVPIALEQVLQTQLFGVPAAEPAVLALATDAFAICGLAPIACPARLAAGMDPAAALKE